MRYLTSLLLFSLFALVLSPAHAQQTPRDAMSQFLTAWKKHDFKAMAKATQRRQKATAAEVANWYDEKKLQSFSITKVEKISPLFSKVSAKITYRMGEGKPQTHTIKGSVLNEGGKWGVNYISTIRED